MTTTTHVRPLRSVPVSRPDGAGVELRALAPGDSAAVLAVFAGMGSRSRWLRFLAAKPRLTSADLRRLTAVDRLDHVAVVASTPHDHRPVGIARFVRASDDARSAEVAVAVADAWQRQGVGTLLLGAMVESGAGGRGAPLHDARVRRQRRRSCSAATVPGRPVPRARRSRRRGVLRLAGRGTLVTTFDVIHGVRHVPAIATLLGVWAHPDDEAYLSSGLMSVVRKGGGRVVVVTATRGEHGTDDPSDVAAGAPRAAARARADGQPGGRSASTSTGGCPTATVSWPTCRSPAASRTSCPSSRTCGRTSSSPSGRTA